MNSNMLTELYSAKKLSKFFSVIKLGATKRAAKDVIQQPQGWRSVLRHVWVERTRAFQIY
jgi:hypothetical protein